MYKKKRTWILPVLGAAIALLTAVVCQFAEYRAKESEAAVQADQAAVDRFLEAPREEPFVNEAALKGFAKKEKAAPKVDPDAKYTYLSPEGIQFISKSEAWDQQQLKALYQELLKNKHGEEFMTLSQVVVYPQKDEFAAAMHQNSSRTTRYRLRHPAMDYQVDFSQETGLISLYNGDENTTVESMAMSLSHEYGHHYTFYHMFKDTVDEKTYLDSEYAKLRKLPPKKVLTDRTNQKAYYDNHYWYLIEIAAEDYMTLMGSPTARTVEDYFDIRGRLNGEDREMVSARNSVPQENMMIPMANEVKGLAAYYYSFIGESAPKFSPEKKLELSIDSYLTSYDLVSGYEEFLSYEFTWDKVYGEDAVYTLISYQEDDYWKTIHPVKTVFADESAVATIGRVTSESGSRINYAWDELAQGTRTFVVTVMLPDGTLHLSTPLTYTF